MKSSIFIILEFIARFVFGVLGGYAFSFFNRYNNLDTSIVLAFTSAFVALLLGVGIIGFIYLKRTGRVKDLGRSIALSLLGLILFLIICIVIELLAYQELPYYISSIILPIILPLTGAVLGFNYNNYTRQRL
jgi:Ca2+/Na+ antiporter